MPIEVQFLRYSILRALNICHIDYFSLHVDVQQVLEVFPFDNITIV